MAYSRQRNKLDKIIEWHHYKLPDKFVALFPNAKYMENITLHRIYNLIHFANLDRKNKLQLHHSRLMKWFGGNYNKYMKMFFVSNDQYIVGKQSMKYELKDDADSLINDLFMETLKDSMRLDMSYFDKGKILELTGREYHQKTELNVAKEQEYIGRFRFIADFDLKNCFVKFLPNFLTDTGRMQHVPKKEFEKFMELSKGDIYNNFSKNIFLGNYVKDKKIQRIITKFIINTIINSDRHYGRMDELHERIQKKCNIELTNKFDEKQKELFLSIHCAHNHVQREFNKQFPNITNQIREYNRTEKFIDSKGISHDDHVGNYISRNYESPIIRDFQILPEILDKIGLRQKDFILKDSHDGFQLWIDKNFLENKFKFQSFILSCRQFHKFFEFDWFHQISIEISSLLTSQVTSVAFNFSNEKSMEIPGVFSLNTLINNSTHTNLFNYSNMITRTESVKLYWSMLKLVISEIVKTWIEKIEIFDNSVVGVKFFEKCEKKLNFYSSGFI